MRFYQHTCFILRILIFFTTVMYFIGTLRFEQMYEYIIFTTMFQVNLFCGLRKKNLSKSLQRTDVTNPACLGQQKKILENELSILGNELSFASVSSVQLQCFFFKILSCCSFQLMLTCTTKLNQSFETQLILHSLLQTYTMQKTNMQKSTI